MDRLTFLRLCVSDAETTASSLVKPASRACRAPRRLGTSAEYLTDGAFAARFHTSSASAICGIADGRTNDTASILRTPVVDSASRSATRVGRHRLLILQPVPRSDPHRDRPQFLCL